MQYLDASFRGVKFFVDNSEVTVGRRTVTHEYPFRNYAYTEDLGRAATVYRFEAFVLGDDYVDQANKLREELEKKGQGTLVHPMLGELQVCCTGVTSITFSSASKRIARFSLEFVEVGQNEYPKKNTATKEKSLQTADFVLQYGIEDFSLGFDLGAVEDFVKDALGGDILNALDIIKNSDLAAVFDFADRISDLANDALSILGTDPRAFAQKLANACGFSRFATTVAGWQNVAHRLKNLTEKLRTPKYETSQSNLVNSAASQKIQENREKVYSLCRRIMISNLVGVSTLIGSKKDSTFINQSILAKESQHTLVSDSVTISYNEMIETRDMIVKALEVELMQTENPKIFKEIRNAMTAVSLDMSYRAKDFGVLRDVVLGSDYPVCVIAQELYGDATRETEITIRNKIRHPLFAQQRLKVLDE